MKKYMKRIALVLSCTLILAFLAGCKGKEQAVVGKVNGSVIPDGLFINHFATQVYEAQQAEDTAINFDLTGEELYNNVRETKKDGKSYYDIFIDAALEDSRKFMIQYQVFSGKEEWPEQSEIDEMKKDAESYLTQMLTYYGASMGASTVQELAQVGYSMTYENLIEYFTMSSTLERYKAVLEEKLAPSEDEIAEFYAEHESDYRTVEVRHSLLKTEDLDAEEKEEVYQKALSLVERYNAGEITFADILKETDDVSSSGEANNDGYYTVQADSSFVKAFKDWALARTEASEEIEIVESEYGYHIMQCTKILGIEEEDVKETVEAAYRTEQIDSRIEEETGTYLENQKYAISDLDRGYAEKLAKRTFTGDFSDVEDAVTPAPSAEPTAKPVYNDAEADLTEIAKYKGQAVLKTYYVQFFSQAMNEIFTGYDFSAAGDDEEEFYKLLNEAVQKEYKDGKTYLEYGKEYGLELLLNFLATKNMAEDEGKTLSEEDRIKQLEELDAQIDSMLQYYGTAYGVSTRDELLKVMVSVGVNDYKAIYADQLFVSDYANGVIEDMKPAEDALKAFYEQDPDAYRIVTIRHISKSLLDKDGNLISEEAQAEVLKLLETLKTKLENGDSAEALVSGYSDATDATSSAGLVDLKKTSTALGSEVVDWAFSQSKLGAVAILKTDSSYELVILEGLTDYTDSTGTVANSTNTSQKTVAASVTTAYKNDAFDKSVKQYIAENKLALTDVKSDVVDAVITDFLTYEKRETDK